MRISRLVAGVLALILLVPEAGAAEKYRLLELDGDFVKWGEPRFGAGAVITYALADRPRRFPDAINCKAVKPIDDLARTSELSVARIERELKAALAAWEQVADVRFIAADPSEADILIGAQIHPRGYAFANVEPDASRPDSRSIAAGPSRRLYAAGFGTPARARQPAVTPSVAPISQSLVCLNPEKRWKAGYDGDLETYDLRYTLMHEIGHAIGLDHAGGSGELMSFRYLETFRGPQPGDIAGAVRLYGRPAPR